MICVCCVFFYTQQDGTVQLKPHANNNNNNKAQTRTLQCVNSIPHSVGRLC